MSSSRKRNNTPIDSSKPNKSPAFQFYPKDFLTDAKVLCMTNEVLGMYIRLLCIDWLEDGIYEDVILKLGNYDWLDDEGNVKGSSALVQQQLAACFIPHPYNEGRITNARLLKERENQLKWRMKCQQGGINSAISRGNKFKGSSGLVPSKGEVKGNSSSSSSSSSSNNNNKSALSSADFNFPELLNRDLCKQALDHWIEHRKALRKPLTKTAGNLLLQKYKDRAGDFIRDIKHSIMGGYQGVFPPKVDPPKFQPNESKQELNQNQSQLLERVKLKDPLPVGKVLTGALKQNV